MNMDEGFCWQCIHGMCFEDRSVGIDPEWECALLDDDPSMEAAIPDRAGEAVPCPFFEENDWKERMIEEERIWHQILAEEDQWRDKE